MVHCTCNCILCDLNNQVNEKPRNIYSVKLRSIRKSQNNVKFWVFKQPFLC